MLEVVSTSKEDELSSLRAAAAAGVDWVLGGTHAAEGAGILPEGCAIARSRAGSSIIQVFCSARSTKSRPMPNGSPLSTTSPASTCWHIAIRPLITQALIREVVRRSSGPVIVAGSIASIDRVLAVSEAGAWGYTIGSAIFDGLLPGVPSVADQVRCVLEATAAHASRETRT